jgi:hypothetical protein
VSSESVSRLSLLKWALCAALLCGLLLSPHLWWGVRAFPPIPIAPGLLDLPVGLTIFLSATMFASIGAIAIMKRPRWPLAALLFSAAILVVFDINRLQPYFYQYLIMLLALAGELPLALPDVRAGRERGSGGEGSHSNSLAIAAFVVVSIYFWSGLQKANHTFHDEIFPWLVKPLVGDLGRLAWIAYVAPFLETTIGILLLIPRTRLLGIIGSGIMHGFLLLALGPLGHNYNSIVWPWNFWMFVFVLILFARNRDPRSRGRDLKVANKEPILKLAWGTPMGKGIAVLVGVLPILNFAGLWDGFLSASFYSGRLRDAWIYFTPNAYARLPLAMRENNTAIVFTDKLLFRLDVTQWAIQNLNVPPYAEPRCYSILARKLKVAGVPGDEMFLQVRDRPTLAGGKKTFTSMPIP